MTPEINVELQYQNAIDAGNLFAEWLLWIMLGLLILAFFDRKRLARNAAAKIVSEESLSHHKSPSAFSTTHSKQTRTGQIV
jgi:hypothetical protein